MSRIQLLLSGLTFLALGFAVGFYTSAPISERLVLPTPPPVQAPLPARYLQSQSALEDVLREPDPYIRAGRLANVLPLLGPEEVPDVTRLLNTPAFDRGAPEISLLVRFWSEHDPEGAASWAYAKSPRGYRLAAVMPAIENWARVDPLAALTQVNALRMANQLYTGAEEALVRGWFEAGGEGLGDYVRSLGAAVEQQRAVAAFCRLMILRDGPGPVIEWAESLPEGTDTLDRFKLAAFRQLVTELTEVDPPTASSFCERHCEGPFSSNLLKLIASSWVRQDPEATMAWLSSTPAGKERDRAVLESYIKWWKEDREGATAYIESRGQAGIEPWLRPALESYAMPLSWVRPELALEWAGLIDDESRREVVTIAIVRRWMQHDEKAANLWLARSPLSAEARLEAAKPPTTMNRKHKASNSPGKAAPPS